MPSVIADGTRLPFSDAVKFFEKKIGVTTTHWTDVWKEAHARGFMVAGAASEALVEDFRQAVRRAIADGTTLVQFRDEFDRIVKTHGWQHTGEAGWRASIIYDTNLSMAYSAGQYAQLTDPNILRAYPYWRYVHGLHGTPQRPRAQHVAWSGLVLRCDDPFWDTHFPPNGWRCTCGVEAVSDYALREEGKDGPDPSPVIKTRPWRNPKTGQIVQVPEGIDPGFDYNPGKASAAIGANPDGRPFGRPPEPLPTAEPGSIEDRLQRLRERRDGGPGAEPVALPPSATPAPPAPLEDGKKRAPRKLGDRPLLNYADWVTDQELHKQSDGSARVIGRLPPQAVAVAPKGTKPAVVITAARLLHLLRDTKQFKKKVAISAADAADLPAHLARPMAVLRDRTDGSIIFVFRPRQDDKRRLAKVTIDIGRTISIAGLKHVVNAVATATLVNAASLRQPEYELLSGAIEDEAGN